jgi:thiazole synthase
MGRGAKSGIDHHRHDGLFDDDGDAVLVNTALAVARDPGAMGAAFKKGVEAGREAYLAGLGKQQDRAEASSPLTGFLGS